MKEPTSLVVVIALLTVTAPALAGLDPGEGDAQVQVPNASVLPEDCTPHPVIQIYEDVGPQGFVIEDSVTGDLVYRPGSGVVAGSGSAEDPYVIEGWCVMATGQYHPGTGAHVDIRDTSAHVLIQNNVIVGISAQEEEHEVGQGSGSLTPIGRGIVVERANNVAILGNTVLDVSGGIDIRQATGDNNAVRGNTVSGTLARNFDIRLWRSSGVSLSDNVLQKGIWFDGSIKEHFVHDVATSNTVKGSPVHYIREASDVTVSGDVGQIVILDSEGVDVEGIEFPPGAWNLVGWSQGVHIGNNTHTGITSGVSTADQLYLLHSEDVTIEENTVEDVWLHLENSHGNRIIGNSLTGGLGLSVVDGDNNTVAQNTLRDLYISVRDGDNTLLQENTINESPRRAIHVRDTTATRIENNTITGGSGAGVSDWGTSTVIGNNTITGQDAGIDKSSGGDGVTIWGNDISANAGPGIHIAGGGSDVFVRENTIAQNAGHGIETSLSLSVGTGEISPASRAVIEGNTITSNGLSGAYLWTAQGFEVLDNRVEANAISGIEVQHGTANTIRSNTIVNNGQDGLRVVSPDCDQSAYRAHVEETGTWGCWFGHDSTESIRTGAGSNLNTVQLNNVTGNERYGVHVDYSFGDRINQNNIWDNGEYGLYAEDTHPVHALENWWGCEQGPVDGPDCDGIGGESPVVFNPWLTQANPQAGAG